MHLKIVVVCTALGLAGLAGATTLDIPAALVGEDEREDAAAPCLQEDAFTAGVASTAASLRVGGTAYGCNAEFAACFEFDLDAAFGPGPRPAGADVLSATLVVRKTGWADDAQGFAYTAAFAYLATGAPILVPRDDLDPDTALDVLYPPVANVDLSFDVVAALRDALDDDADRLGLLLAGVYSEAGYEDYITVGGAGSAAPPRLVVVFNEPVATTGLSWSTLKAVWR